MRSRVIRKRLKRDIRHYTFLRIRREFVEDFGVRLSFDGWIERNPLSLSEGFLDIRKIQRVGDLGDREVYAPEFSFIDNRFSYEHESVLIETARSIVALYTREDKERGNPIICLSRWEITRDLLKIYGAFVNPAMTFWFYKARDRDLRAYFGDSVFRIARRLKLAHNKMHGKDGIEPKLLTEFTSKEIPVYASVLSLSTMFPLYIEP